MVGPLLAGYCTHHLTDGGVIDFKTGVPLTEMMSSMKLFGAVGLDLQASINWRIAYSVPPAGGVLWQIVNSLP